tara:strand:+ start:19273 stop:20397 length:1125 start_codon:yes stop_codon:yes gene_type:complete
MKNRVLFISLAGADPLTVQHMVADGEMPTMAALFEESQSCQLRWRPYCSYVGDWLSVATGAPPWRHGVVTTACAKPASLGTAPASRIDLLAPPIWETMANKNYPSAAIGWPATQHSWAHHCDIFSDAFFVSSGKPGVSFPAFSGSFCTQNNPRELLSLRVHARDIDQAVPINLREALARASGKTSVARYLLVRDTAAIFLHYDLLETLGLPRTELEASSILQYYKMQDAMLGQVLADQGKNTSIFIVFRPPSIAFKKNRTEAEKRGLVLFRPRPGFAQNVPEILTPTDISKLVLAASGQPNRNPKFQAVTAGTTRPNSDLNEKLKNLALVRNGPLTHEMLAATRALLRTNQLCKQSFDAFEAIAGSKTDPSDSA